MILLINPPAPTVPLDTLDVPLGLAYVAAALRRAGFCVSVLDYAEHSIEVAGERLQADLPKIAPSIVGVSAVSATYDYAKLLLRTARAVTPGAYTVLGGVHVTLSIADIVASRDYVADTLVVGEGEETMVEIARRVENGQVVSEIPGTVTRNVNGAYVWGRRRDWIEDLDSIPIPARDLFSRSDRVVRVLTSRGCPYSCNFCASSTLWDRQIRFHSPARVESEIRELVEGGADHVLIVDDTFTLQVPRAIDILERLQSVPVKLSCLSRVERMSEQMVDAMTTAGVRSVSLGCESGDNGSLAAMNKGITTDDIRSAISVSQAYGLKLRTSWMWGLPFDTVSSLDRTVDLILETKPAEVILYRFVPFPGTELFSSYPELQNVPSSEFFTGQGRFLAAIPGMTIDEMDSAFNKALDRLAAGGYRDPNDSGHFEYTVSTGFVRFSSFWPKE